MKKRIISVILAVIFVFASMIPAFAAQKSDVLRFDENGEFKILHLCDCQDNYPLEEQLVAYVNYVLEVYKPDIVVLGGDNSIGPKETKEKEVAELAEIFVKHETYFTLVFGNHDHEQGVDKETLLKYFQKHGGKYCLAYDAVPELHGTANHNLPVYASDGNEVKFNMWLLDSGNYVHEDNDPEKKRLGYDSVTPDQIEWYKKVSEKLEKQEGGKVPSMVFQHMVVGEIYDAMFPRVPFALSPITETYNNGRHYPVIFPDTSKFKGHIFEPPSPGYYNHGEFDAMRERGDVTAILVGHDHVNSYEVKYKGIEIINTPSPTFHSYSNLFTRGARLITVKEDDAWDVESEILAINKLVMKDKDFSKEMEISRFEGFFWHIVGAFHLLLKNLTAPFAAILLWS
ncbi:MAG: metallophosphoesterase [Clostridia bacterium]|nr:metallophosphoesterase [Clostridia bacterium]